MYCMYVCMFVCIYVGIMYVRMYRYIYIGKWLTRYACHIFTLFTDTCMFFVFTGFGIPTTMPVVKPTPRIDPSEFR